MKTEPPSIGIAASAVRGSASRTLELVPAEPARSASVIKPLLAWVAALDSPLAENLAMWENLARQSITTSDNDAAAKIWSRSGEERLLEHLDARVGSNWQIDPGREHPSLRVLVTPGDLGDAFASLVSDDSEIAARVRHWMRAVPAEQTLGVRRIAGDVLDADEGVIGVKCGWFGGERAHAVVVAEDRSGIIGAAVTTTRMATPSELSTMAGAAGDDMKLAQLHDELVGEHLRGAVRQGLLAAHDL